METATVHANSPAAILDFVNIISASCWWVRRVARNRVFTVVDATVEHIQPNEIDYQ